MSNSIKITDQIEESISKKICISEIVMIIDRLLKGLASLNIGQSELNLIHRLSGKPTIELIHRLIKFNEFASNLTIKLIKWPKNCILHTAECISNGKNLKIKPVDLSLEDKFITYCFELPCGIVSHSSYVNIETMNIISSDVED